MPVTAEVNLCLVYPAPVVCITINLTSLCNGFSLKAAVESAFMQDYLSVFIAPIWEEGLYQI